MQSLKVFLFFILNISYCPDYKITLELLLKNVFYGTVYNPYMLGLSTQTTKDAKEQYEAAIKILYDSMQIYYDEEELLKLECYERLYDDSIIIMLDRYIEENIDSSLIKKSNIKRLFDFLNDIYSKKNSQMYLMFTYFLNKKLWFVKLKHHNINNTFEIVISDSNGMEFCITYNKTLIKCGNNKWLYISKEQQATLQAIIDYHKANNSILLEGFAFEVEAAVSEAILNSDICNISKPDFSAPTWIKSEIIIDDELFTEQFFLNLSNNQIFVLLEYHAQLSKSYSIYQIFLIDNKIYKKYVYISLSAGIFRKIEQQLKNIGTYFPAEATLAQRLLAVDILAKLKNIIPRQKK